MKNVLFTLMIFLIVPLAESGNRQPSGYVSFCEIARNPEKYDQRKVLTAGIIDEHGLFFDPACRPNPNPDVTLPADLTLPFLENSSQRSPARKRLDQLLEMKKPVFVVVEARFDAYNRYKGALPADERLQELLKKGHSRFGHDNCCRFRLAIQAVRLAEPAQQLAAAPATTHYAQPPTAVPIPQAPPTTPTTVTAICLPRRCRKQINSAIP